MSQDTPSSPPLREPPANGSYRKKPVVIQAAQWFKNGDHPDDYAADTEGMIDGVQRTISGAYRREREWEGYIVRYFRHPSVDGQRLCQHCRVRMHDHGWIDTLEGGHTVCPGDWIITGVQGEHYPCKPDIFAATYEAVQPSDPPAPAAVPGEVARLIEQLAIEYHKSPDGEGEYGCNGLTCPGVQRLIGFVSSVVAALASSGAASPASPWQPISTAPKDGTHILAWRDSGIGMMRWRERRGDTGGFWDEWHVKRPSEPTHWMPLPDPPAASVGDPQTERE